MMLQSCKSFAKDDPFLMLHTGFSVNTKFSGSLKVEWAVLPPCSNVAAIPDDATAIAIFPSDLIFAAVKFIQNDFPVPASAFRKYTFPLFLSTLSRISL